MRTLSVSIDLDPLYCYYDIHGIGEYRRSGLDPIYTISIERIRKFFDDMGIRPTLFVVGEQLQNDEVVDILKSAVDNGYEIANHTYSHRYDFSLLTEEEIEEEVVKCKGIISDRLAVDVCGFRAPGYNINSRIIKTLISLGYKYDSSILPSPFYYFAKAGIILMYRIIGRGTRSICGSVRMPFAKREPYFTDEKSIYKDGGKGIVEAPISVAGIFGFPYVGTFIMGYKDWAHNYLVRKSGGISYLQIELHGIDFLDSRDIQDQRLLESQFDISVPLDKKLDRLKSLIDRFKPDQIKRLSDIDL